MKKNNFIALIFWVASGFLFAIGMCAALIPEWNAFNYGIALGLSGAVLALITLIIWRRKSGKNQISLSLRTVSTILIGAAGTLAFGLGMCFSMLWDKISIGIVISLAGVAMLLSLIPILKGIED